MLEKNKNLDIYRKRWSEIFRGKKEKEVLDDKPRYKKNKLAKVPIEKSKNYE